MADVVDVNPQILVWARERAGLSLAAAAKKLGLAAERLDRLEIGEAGPSPSLLKRIAAAYRRPLVTFYMAAPPASAEPMGDFRTLTAPAPHQEGALLDALIRDIRTRQAIVRDLLEDDEDTNELPFVSGSRMDEGVEAVAAKVRQTLGVTHGDQQSAKDAESLFKLLRRKTENVGVFVILAGDLGSPQHNGISVETFRGYALVDKMAPFIVINDKDAKTARNFTLVHELAHLFLGEEGVSGPISPEYAHLLPPVEIFCNQVASEFLLPEAALSAVPADRAEDRQYIEDTVEKIAKNWNVSRLAVMYRLYRARHVKKGTWEEYRERYKADLTTSHQRDKEKSAGKEGGPNYYVVRRDRLGNGLLSLARQTLSDGSLSYTKAAKLLAVKASNVAPLLNDGR